MDGELTDVEKIVKRALSVRANEVLQSKFIDSYTANTVAIYVDDKQGLHLCSPYVKQDYNYEFDGTSAANTFIVKIVWLESITKEEIIQMYSYLPDMSTADICNDLIRSASNNKADIRDIQSKIESHIWYLKDIQYSTLINDIANALYYDPETRYPIQDTINVLHRNYEIFEGWKYEPTD